MKLQIVFIVKFCAKAEEFLIEVHKCISSNQLLSVFCFASVTIFNYPSTVLLLRIFM